MNTSPPDQARTAEEWIEQAEALADRCADCEDGWEVDGPAEPLQWLREAGLLPLPLARIHCGPGFEIEPEGMLTMLRILKAIGRGSLPLGRIYEGHVNALRLIQSFGNPGQIVSMKIDVEAGHVFGIWNTGVSDDVTILDDGAHAGRLEGAKVFASGSTLVTRPLISGRLPAGGSQLILLKLDEIKVNVDPTWWNPMGMTASVSHRIEFDGVEVSSEDFLGEPGSYERQPWLSAGAMRFAAVQLGAAEALLDITSEHLRSRDRTDHPYQQERVARMSLDVESGRLWLGGAADQARLAESSPEILIHYVGMMRTAIEEICYRIIQSSHQCVGVAGMLKPHRLERVTRDLLTYLRQPNPDGSLMGAGKLALSAGERSERLWHNPQS